MHATICDYIADTVQNSIEAGASEIDLSFSEIEDIIEVMIKDNGKGMDDATLAKVWDPFYTEEGKHEKRHIGMGLPMLRQVVENTDGEVSLESGKGSGTSLKFSFSAGHPDTPPLGDVATTVTSLINYAGECKLRFKHIRGSESYVITTDELESVLGNLHEVTNVTLVRDFLRAQESGMETGVTFATTALASTKKGTAAPEINSSKPPRSENGETYT